MDKNEILEYNEMIARFMGKSFPSGHITDFIYGELPITMNKHYLKYHKSWSQLMPVVEKLMDICDTPILGMSCHTFFLGITSLNIKMELNRRFYYFDGYFIEYNSRIEAIYDVIVRFIKWYIKNK